MAPKDPDPHTEKGRRLLVQHHAQTENLDCKGFDSSRFLMLMRGIPRSSAIAMDIEPLALTSCGLHVRELILAALTCRARPTGLGGARIKACIQDPFPTGSCNAEHLEAIHGRRQAGRGAAPLQACEHMYAYIYIYIYI